MFKRQKNSKKNLKTLSESVNKQPNLNAGDFDKLPQELLFLIYTFAAQDFFKFPLVCKQFYKLFNAEQYQNHRNAIWRELLGPAAKDIKDPKKLLIEKFKRHNELKKATSGVKAFFEKPADQMLMKIEKCILEDDAQGLATCYGIYRPGEIIWTDKFRDHVLLKKFFDERLSIIMEKLAYKCFTKFLHLVFRGDECYYVKGNDNNHTPFTQLLVDIIKDKLSKDANNYFTRKFIQLLLDPDRCKNRTKAYVFSELSELNILNLEKKLNDADKEKLFVFLVSSIRELGDSFYKQQLQHKSVSKGMSIIVHSQPSDFDTLGQGRDRTVSAIKVIVALIPSVLNKVVTAETCAANKKIFIPEDIGKTLFDYALQSSPQIKDIFKASAPLKNSFTFEENRQDAISISEELTKLYQSEQIDFAEVEKLLAKLSALSAWLKEAKQNKEGVEAVNNASLRPNK